MRTIPLALIAMLVLPLPLLAQPDPKNPPQPPRGRPPGEVGPPATQIRISSRVYVGEDAPDFELTDANGRPFRLSRMRGERVLLVFADRRDLLVPYAAAADSLRSLGVLMVGVCHDSPQSLRTTATRDNLSFPLVSDPTGEIAAIYGAYDFLGSSIVSGFVMVGVRGKVRMVFLGEALPPEHVIELTKYTLSGL
jgi:peroxiredoxin Q/BCP